jgi:DNA-directed RNA polymerase specialized sigma24 family protein
METYLRDVPVDAAPSEEPTMGLASREVGGDPAEAVALIAAARRGRLLRVHRRRLRWEDLEDCYSQATLELVTRSRRTPFVSHQHILNSLEQKFLSRIEDRRRAIGGRSAIETAIARAVPVDSPDHGASELEDRGAAVEHQVIARIELRRLREVIADLSRDQQLVLASQVYVDMGAGEFCARHGWSVEKYRKVAQRARGKLRVLVEEYERGERCRRLEADLLAMCAGVAEDQALARARAHVAHCPTCARMVGDLDRAAHSVAALLPIPGPVALGSGGLAVKLTGVWAAARRAVAIVRHPLTEIGAGGGTGVAGGSLASVGALKVGIAAVCVAGAAGSYAVCAHLGVLPAIGIGLGHQVKHQAAAHPRRSAKRRFRAAVPASASEARGSSVGAGAGGGGRDRRVLRPVRVSAITQIRREFGSPPVRTASATRVGAGGSRSSTSGARSSLSAAAARAQTSQTQSEFGFEK